MELAKVRKTLTEGTMSVSVYISSGQTLHSLKEEFSGRGGVEDEKVRARDEERRRSIRTEN